MGLSVRARQHSASRTTPSPPRWTTATIDERQSAPIFRLRTPIDGTTVPPKISKNKEERSMDFTMSDRQREWLERVSSFMTKHVRPAVPIYKQQDAEGERWKVIPIVEELKAKAKAEGLWNMFMPPSSHEDDEFHGAGLSNLEYAMLAEQMGHIGWASEVFNCSAPDTGNMEVFMRYGTKEHKQTWLKPLMNGEIRSAFLMTEPDVASSDATNIETSIKREGDEYVINGTKWWSSGMGDPRCKIMIVMGKTDPNAPKHQAQSQILVPADAKGVIVEKMLPVFGFDDAPHGHARVRLDNVRVPVSNILLGEGRGFEIAQGRLGPGRIHHCMRTIGKAEEALEKMVRRLQSRTAFGKKIIEYSVWEERIAQARTDIEMNRLLCLKAADMMDKVGNKTAQLEIAMIKVSGPNMALKIIDNAIQAYGGAGVSDDAGLAKDYASMRTMRLADGPDEVHNRAIARLELKKYANQAKH
jgi:acyl-CoA dehydrogenase